MRGQGGHGAVAAGSRLATAAGLRALELGGNAVDAAVAASMAAWVAEPIFTGLGGSGLGMIRMHGEVYVWDFFSDMPGLDLAHQAGVAPADYRLDFSQFPMVPVELNYGPTTQVFVGGRGAVAVPGMPRGLWELHQAHGRLPLPLLARPAMDAARQGVAVNACFETTANLVGPILRLSPAVQELLWRGDGPLRAGGLLHNPLLGASIERYAEEGPRFLETGAGAEAMLRFLGSASAVGPNDLRSQRPRRRTPISLQYRNARIWFPGPPSLGGLLIACALAHLESGGPLPAGFGLPSIQRVAAAMQAAECRQDAELRRRLMEPEFTERFLAACPAGSTTHISTIDRDGNAVALTSSMGETCGHMVPETGILLNNFLGEDDVNPPDARRAPGQRMITMTCPTLMETRNGTFVLGSGGSSRIRSAIMHGILYLVDHGLPVDQAVAAPRAHMEAGSLKVELAGRPVETWSSLAQEFSDMVRFDHPHFYFGGLHVAGLGPDGFVGAGDVRRSGEFGRC